MNFTKTPHQAISESSLAAPLTSTGGEGFAKTELDRDFFLELLSSGIRLNDRQIQAVQHTSGPLLTIAGAGSGKTSVLTARTAYLMTVKEIDPSNILLITFTRKASEEMRQRISALPGVAPSQANSLTAGTFHSIFLKLLRSIGYNQKILNSERHKQIIMKNILKKLNSTQSSLPEIMLSSISSCKVKMVEPHEVPEGKETEELKKAYQEYETWKASNGYMDFDDILVFTYREFLNNPQLLQKMQKRFQYVLVDEFQDTNPIQYELIKSIAAPQNNLFVVGDDDQVIYSFNGANSSIILEFDSTYPDAKVVTLDTNYRSTPDIVGLGNHIIKHNEYRRSKWMNATDKEGSKPSYIRPATTEEEATIVLENIREQEREWKDIVILTRTYTNARAIFEQLVEQDIPFNAQGMKQVFYEQTIIKGMLDHLRLAYQHDSLDATAAILPSLFINQEAGMRHIEMENFVDPIDFPLRHLTSWKTLRPFQQKAIEKRISLIKEAKRLHPKKAIQLLREDYMKHLDNANDETITVHKTTLKEMMDELEFSSSRFETLPEFLGYVDRIITRFNEHKKKPYTKNALSLLSIHQAKGLEYPVVYLIGASETILPHVSALTSMKDKEASQKDLYLKNPSADLEEERRLCYVAITRAKEEIYISSPEKHLGKQTPVSRFLTEAFKNKKPLSDLHVKAWICSSDFCKGWMKINGKQPDEKECPLCKKPMIISQKAILKR
ncbi:UvrD-helicase domain-containing protein [Alkalihalobacillus sp. CinArs1]|uniref:UvrD-helicase domain-containing protein n=1 Tax=Alkalihalobacillus sp. CinArs1 TaxID=2995314 RepID=UPI0022DDFC9F|nr:UvrD-helicase domain-containing protein [Alkalihalobacillus sp. CinArs1]